MNESTNTFKAKRRKNGEVSSSENEGNMSRNFNRVKKDTKTPQREDETEVDATMVYNQTNDTNTFNSMPISSTPIVRHKKKKSTSVQRDSVENLELSSSLDNLVDSTGDDATVRDSENKTSHQNRTRTDTSQDPNELLASLFSHSKQVNMNFKLKFSKKEDIHLLSIPKCIDPMSLLNREIELDTPSRFKVDKQKYILEPTGVTPPASLVVGSNWKVIKPKSSIFIKRHIKPVKLPEPPLLEKKAVPLPNDLKQRHPLFGSDFEGKINLSQEVEQKLNDAIERFMVREEKIKHKKLKKKKKKETLEKEQPNEVIFDLLNAHQTKNSSEKEDSAYSSTSSKNFKGNKIKQEALTEHETDCESVSKKRKKKKTVNNDNQ